MITHAGRFGTLVASSLLLAPAALANEAITPPLASSAQVTGTPWVLGAPPAWGLMLLGVAVVGLTVLRRVRKTVPQRVPRR